MKWTTAILASIFSTTTTYCFTTPSATVFRTSSLNMSASTVTPTAPSWTDLQSTIGNTQVGKALNDETIKRTQGRGSAFVQNRKRLFDSKIENPPITLFRDHAGWCPYCQKTMLLIEEKQIPINIDLVPMRSYGDKPSEFLQKVPNGLLPAIEVNGQIITESQVIMELLDEWHTEKDGYKPMLPRQDDTAGWNKYNQLARLERELFSWWCTLIFRPEGGVSGGLRGLLGGGGGSGGGMSGSMQGFMDCIKKVDQALTSTKGPWFFDEYDYPTMIDFIYVSHVERMLASCAYWKGLNLRDPKYNLKGLNTWLEAFEKREHYLAFKSDYYTHVKDIPPQYGPGYNGGFEQERVQMSNCILGKDGSWTLPLSFDDPLQPLYKGPPLPLCVLEAAGIQSDSNGSYETADPITMSKACRLHAAWKLSGNGNNVSKFAARGGPNGAKNPRKTFGAELADPYAASDENVQPIVDAALRVICDALKDVDNEPDIPSEKYRNQLLSLITSSSDATTMKGVITSLEYLRDRIGTPRDLPLAASRYLRAYLNWGIDILKL